MSAMPARCFFRAKPEVASDEPHLTASFIFELEQSTVFCACMVQAQYKELGFLDTGLDHSIMRA